jgi:hypothetical protein
MNANSIRPKIFAALADGNFDSEIAFSLTTEEIAEIIAATTEEDRNAAIREVYQCAPDMVKYFSGTSRDIMPALLRIMEAKRKAAAKPTYEELLDALATALPFVEDAETDKSYKPGVISKHGRHIRSLIESADRR